MNKTKFFLSLAISFVLSGCNVEPVGDALSDIQKSSNIPSKWMFATINQNTSAEQLWWESFASPDLNKLVNIALENNQNLAAAGFTLKKAQVAIGQAKVNQFPVVSGNFSGDREHVFTNNNTQGKSYGATLSASYEVDLWKKLATTTDVAKWTAQATAEDMLATRLSLIGNVVNGYFKWLYTESDLELNAKQIHYQQQTLNLVNSQFSAGSASQLDVISAQKSLTGLENTRTSLQSQHQQAENALSILLGQPPQHILLNLPALDSLALPEISAGIPANILRRRPDLRAAQYKLQADLGNISVSELGFYPTFSLTTKVSTGSDKLLTILRNPIGSLAASIALPFLQYQDNKLKVLSSKYQYEADLANFRQTLYNAFADVENALVSLKESDDSSVILTQELKQATDIKTLRQMRYQTGADDLQKLLDAQQEMRNVQSALLENRYNRLTRRVALYLALGGSPTTD